MASYNVYFAGRPGLTKWNSSKVPHAGNPITVTDLVPGKTYHFGIAAVSESGESGILNETAYTATETDGSINFGELKLDDRKPKGQVIRQQVPEGPVILRWDNVPNAISYNMYWSESPGVTRKNGKKIANVANPYTITWLKAGKTYYFVVTAVGSTGESKESREMSFSVK